jgi:hypothetical protein
MKKANGSGVAKARIESPQVSTPVEPEHEQASAFLAYQFWQERGCPIGSPDEDWFRAEQELTAAAVGPSLPRNAPQRHSKATGMLRRGRGAS